MARIDGSRSLTVICHFQTNDATFDIISVPVEAVIRITTTKLKLNKLEIVDRPTPEARLALAQQLCELLANNLGVCNSAIRYSLLKI